MEKTRLIAVVGPTASGKTDLGIRLARLFDGEIVSADSMQVYRGMDIGTAKPTPAERQAAVHHMIGIIPPGETFSVARYCAMAHAVIRDIASRGKLPIVVGGTGLYVDSLINNVRFDSPAKHDGLRTELNAVAEEKGSAALYAALLREDAAAAKTIHPNDARRIVRALESVRQDGRDADERKARSKGDEIYDGLWLAPDIGRQVLYDRINARVDGMIDAGLLDEARRIFCPPQSGESPTAICAIGYKEALRHLHGEISLDEMRELIKRETRRYAKRQMTWFRRNGRINWLSGDDIIDKAQRLFHEKWE